MGKFVLRFPMVEGVSPEEYVQLGYEEGEESEPG
jgi:hypothetical protein